MNNLRQLNLAWMLCAGDNEDRLPPNRNLATSAKGTGWVEGIMDYTGGTDNTNTALFWLIRVSSASKRPCLISRQSHPFLKPSPYWYPGRTLVVPW